MVIKDKFFNFFSKVIVKIKDSVKKVKALLPGLSASASKDGFVATMISLFGITS